MRFFIFLPPIFNLSLPTLTRGDSAARAPLCLFQPSVFACHLDNFTHICRSMLNSFLGLIAQHGGLLKIDYNELMYILFLTKMSVKIFINFADIITSPYVRNKPIVLLILKYQINNFFLKQKKVNS